MTAPFHIDRSSNPKREAVEQWLFGLDCLSDATRDKVVMAWTSAWVSSPYERLEDMPFGPGCDYRLMEHVNEVTRIGIDLAGRAAADWQTTSEPETLLPILMLHDVDKPLMYVREDGKIHHSALYHQLPHGVAGAMLLRELDFPLEIVSTVALHAGNAPYHGRNFEAYVLHYADYFSADHAMIATGNKPFYQK